MKEKRYRYIMSNDFEKTNEEYVEDATSLDALFDAPADDFKSGEAPTEFYYTAVDDADDVTDINWDDNEKDYASVIDEDFKEEKPKKRSSKKSKKK